MLKSSAHKTALSALLTTLGLIISTVIGSAQTNANVLISPPQTDEFPSITLNVSVTDEDGLRVEDLPSSSFQIIENGTSMDPSSIDEIEVGTRQLFVINTNESMGLRDATGRTRFFFAREALLDWWTHPSASQFALDNLTLVTGNGPLVENSSASATLASALSNFDPGFDSEQVNFELLLDSLSYLEQDSSENGMPSFIMFFTTAIGQDQELTLTNAIARAQELGTTVFPILVNPPEELEEGALTPLTQLAEATGGRLITLSSGNPDLSELRQQVIAQRTQYQLEYRSQVTQSGSHQISVRVTGPGLIAESEARSYNVSVLAPEVTFIQPPQQVERASEDPSTSIEMLPPTELPLEILITFPDQHQRAIASSQLLVNGESVSQRVEPPFDRFAWDLSSYAQDQQIDLQARVTDVLGLEGTSGVHTVQLLVEPPPGGLAALEPALVPLALIIGILVLAVVGTVTGLSYARRNRPSLEPTPAQQPSVQPLNRARLQSINRQQAEAFLIPLEGDEAEGDPIPLSGADITLGADASLAAYPLRDPSVSGLHARLIRQAGGDYLLRDQGSVAGTWVNFEQVPEEGQRLRHGDQIQLGRITLRFMLPKPDRTPETKIEILGPEGAEETETSEEGS